MMKVTEMIECLNNVLNQFGDIDVMAMDNNGQERFDVASLVTSGARDEMGNFIGRDVLIITSGPQM